MAMILIALGDEKVWMLRYQLARFLFICGKGERINERVEN